MQQQRQQAAHTPVSIVFRGAEHRLHDAATFAGLLQQLQQQLSGQQLAVQTLKMLLPSKQAGFLPVQQLAADGASLASQGVKPGMRCVLLGSYAHELEEVASAEAAHAALRLPSFEHEAARHAQRAAGGGAASSSSSGIHFFGALRELPAHPGAPPGAPPPAAALALLHKLASDPGIAAAMKANSWRVGVLSEMPPEGRVGVSAVCILGFNQGRGAEIALRLRTDDLAGFRKYRSIRQTLVHELAHMVHDEHDADFKALNSQLLKQVEAAEQALGQTLLAGGPAFTSPAQQQEPEQQQHARPRVLGGPAESSAAPLSQQLAGARQTAGVAALSRWQQHQQQQQVVPQPLVGAGRAVLTQVEAAAQRGDAALSDSLQQWEHDDPRTAAAEDAVRQLEGLTCCCATEAAAPSSPGTVLVHQQQQQQPGHQPDGLMQHDDTAAAPAGGIGPSTASPRGSDGPHEHSGSVSVEHHQLPGADDDVVQDAGLGHDDLVAGKLHRARHLLQQLLQEAGGSEQASEALQTLSSVLRRLATSPEARFRRLRLANATFWQKCARHTAAQELLVLAGFQRRQEGDDEHVLVYVRNDPGLLWLVFSLILEQLQQQA